QVIKKDAKHDAENVKLGATIEKLKYENAELKDRITKVKQNQLQNDSAKGTQDKRNITPNNNLSNFNLGAVHHEKLLKEKEMDNFLLEEKKLSKAEQASLNQDQESDTGHRKKDVENIVQMIADGIKKDTQLTQLFDKADDAKYGAIPNLTNRSETNLGGSSNILSSSSSDSSGSSQRFVNIISVIREQFTGVFDRVKGVNNYSLDQMCAVVLFDILRLRM
ncbi:3972_t:CDS:2, partial [Rhizophagus irregularis]